MLRGYPPLTKEQQDNLLLPRCRHLCITFDVTRPETICSLGREEPLMVRRRRGTHVMLVHHLPCFGVREPAVECERYER